MPDLFHRENSNEPPPVFHANPFKEVFEVAKLSILLAKICVFPILLIFAVVGKCLDRIIENQQKRQK